MYRTNNDGSIWLPRSNKELEDKLDMEMIRPNPDQKLWFPKVESLDIQELTWFFKDKEVNIIGKGPSLDKLKLGDLKGNPTIALNDSIHKVEALGPDLDYTFCIAQDYNLKHALKTKGSGLILNRRIAAWYKEVRRLWVFHPQMFGLPEASLTAMVAVAIASQASRIRMLCFDAAVTGATGYATVIGYQPNLFGPPSRFLRHKSQIEGIAKPALSWELPA